MFCSTDEFYEVARYRFNSNGVLRRLSTSGLLIFDTN